MIRNKHRFRRTFCCQRWRWTLACLVLAAAWLSGTLSAQASIMRPQMPEFTLNDVQDMGSSSSNSCSPPINLPVEQQRQDDQSHLTRNSDAFPSGGSSSSTSSSSAGTGGSSPTAISCLSEVLLADPDIAGRISGQARLSLPKPPGNDLLRPPQAV